MTTAVTNAATLAAFSERYRDRPFVLFNRQPDAIQARWRCVIDLIREGKVTSGKQFRDTYLDGIGAPDRDTDKEWIQLSRADRESWDRVYLAAVRAWQAAEAQESEVAA